MNQDPFIHLEILKHSLHEIRFYIFQDEQVKSKSDLESIIEKYQINTIFFCCKSNLEPSDLQKSIKDATIESLFNDDINEQIEKLFRQIETKDKNICLFQNNDNGGLHLFVEFMIKKEFKSKDWLKQLNFFANFSGNDQEKYFQEIDRRPKYRIFYDTQILLNSNQLDSLILNKERPPSEENQSNISLGINPPIIQSGSNSHIENLNANQRYNHPQLPPTILLETQPINCESQVQQIHKIQKKQQEPVFLSSYQKTPSPPEKPPSPSEKPPSPPEKPPSPLLEMPQKKVLPSPIFYIPFKQLYNQKNLQ